MDRRPDRTVRGGEVDRFHPLDLRKLRIPAGYMCVTKITVIISMLICEWLTLQAIEAALKQETGKRSMREATRTLPSTRSTALNFWTQWNGQDVWNHGNLRENA